MARTVVVCFRRSDYKHHTSCLQRAATPRRNDRGPRRLHHLTSGASLSRAARLLHSHALQHASATPVHRGCKHTKEVPVRRYPANIYRHARYNQEQSCSFDLPRRWARVAHRSTSHYPARPGRTVNILWFSVVPYGSPRFHVAMS